MNKYLFTIIIGINLILFAWQTALGISLSTKGDILNDRLLAIEAMQNQIDLLDNQIAKEGNLKQVSLLAGQKGFVPSKIIRYASESLADANMR